MIQQQEDEKSIFQELGITKKKILFVTLALLALVTYVNSCSVVKQRERGVEYVFGKVSGDVIKPGLKFHAPFVSRIQKYSIAPKTFEAASDIFNSFCFANKIDRGDMIKFMQEEKCDGVEL